MTLIIQEDCSTLVCNHFLRVIKWWRILITTQDWKVGLKFMLFYVPDFSSSLSVLKWHVGIRRFSLSSEMPKNRQSRRKPKATIRRVQPRLHWCSPALCAGWVLRCSHSLTQKYFMCYSNRFGHPWQLPSFLFIGSLGVWVYNFILIHQITDQHQYFSSEIIFIGLTENVQYASKQN